MFLSSQQTAQVYKASKGASDPTIQTKPSERRMQFNVCGDERTSGEIGEAQPYVP